MGYEIIYPMNDSVYNYYCFYARERDKLSTHLFENGIGNNKYYSIPMHLLLATKQLGYKEGDFPQAEKHAREVIAIPMYPELTKEQVFDILHVIRKF
jgi:dTDP-4-amino-4,6-dideoxygalactose transaminase